MKKTLFVTLSLLGAFAANAGDAKAPVTVVDVGPTVDEPDFRPLHQKNPYSLTLSYGIMHTDVGYIDDADTYRDQLVPSVLYGVSLAGKYNVASSENWVHAVGFNAGWYTGSNRLYAIDVDPDFVIDNASIETSVTAIPLLLTYNLEYRVTERLYVFGGARAGALIRKTEVESGYVANGEVSISGSSTKVLPMIGVGAGLRSYLTPNLAFELSYDFGWTLGNDCDGLEYSTGHALESTSQDSRYYGTVKAGFTYSF